MAENVQTLQWIVGSFEAIRAVSRKTTGMDPAIKVTLSFGKKELRDGAVVLHPETGAEIWVESFNKEFVASHQEVGEFLTHVIMNPTSEYAFEIPAAITNLATADALLAGPIYALAKFMLGTGKWEF